MIGVPLGQLAVGEGDDVAGQPQGGLGRENMGAAREIFLEDVVLGGAGELIGRRPLAFGHGDVERQQPGRRGVDRHGGVHALERDAVEQRLHVAQMTHRHADLADLARRQRMVGVVAGLGRQGEGEGKPGLPLGPGCPR